MHKKNLPSVIFRKYTGKTLCKRLHTPPALGQNQNISGDLIFINDLLLQPDSKVNKQNNHNKGLMR